MVEDVPFRDFIRIDDPTTGEKVIIFHHDWAGEMKLRPPITSAVAELTDVSPRRIETELQGSIDSSALERAFEPQTDSTPREGGRLVLLVASCEVTVHSNGWVEIERTAE